tara:strand:+ start:722 stop:1297 length:576 start_codon:yes stop_codon:yes gene_type:complete
MKTKLKIIKLFLNDSNPKTIREISKQISADYKITHIATQRLIKQDILKVQTVGKSSLCKLNDSYYGVEIYEAENERKDKLLKNKSIRQLYKEVMAKIETSFFIVLLFGSYAKGKQTKSSDIDLLIVSNVKNIENKVSDIFSLLPLKTHVLVFTEEEFIRMKDAKRSNVVQEAIENQIILYGIEAYHKLKNA